MTLDPLTPEHVQAALDAFGFGIQIRFFAESTATSQLAADAIGCQLGQIAKSIAFLVEGQPILVIASGDGRVDDKKIALLHNVGRKKVRSASPEECVRLYGYAPGGVPPLAHRTSGMTIYLDESLRRFEQIYAAGGASNAIFPVTLAQLETISNGRFVDVRKEAETTD